ncbi:MAG: tetratricopeptide repeat protein [Planctomycetaceae bacterium]|jgi:tetratricopeptide (TPR) repeat protein|nr:tetratricopeptide repeat protein [Planctomycetaceae bacterium]MBT7254865.1 tetratricopeptide repeat protein [Planctomycetaceae bacterium]MBT7918673.1 tetratricopeptide repeat protein [Planctomycetaceae bacterium]
MMSQQHENDEIENNDNTENTVESVDSLFSDISSDTSATSAFTSLRQDRDQRILDSPPTDEASKTEPTVTSGGIAGKKTVFALVIIIIGAIFLSVMTLDRRTQGMTFYSARELTSEQHFLAALDALHQRHTPDVITHRNALLMLPQQDDRVAVLNAFIALTVEDLTAAANHLKTLQDSDDPLIKTYHYYIVGELQFKQKQYGGSLQALDAAIKVSDQANRKLVPAYQLMASIYYDIGNMQQAMDSATIVSDLDPNNARILRFIGMVQQDYEQWQDSLIAYQRYLELDPFGDLRETVIISMAEVHIKLRQFNQALDQLNQVLVTPRIYALRASCHYNLGDVQDALNALNDALTRDPAQHEAILLKGTIEIQDRSYATAVDTFVSGLRYYPSDDVLMYKLSEAYRGLGDEAKAEELAIRSTILRTKRERFSKLNIDIIGEPTNIAMRLELAKLAEEIGKPELAVIWYQAILTIDSQNQKALFELERIIVEMTRANTATVPFAPTSTLQNPTTTPANQPNQ